MNPHLPNHPLIMNSQNTIDITIWNANGLRKQAIDSILTYTPTSSILFITETWLLPPNKYPTPWKQYHTYGRIPHPNSRRASMGISLLVNPDCPYHVYHLPDLDSPLAPYHLSCTIADILVHCVYLPPSISDNQALEILQNLPTNTPTTSRTIYCGDFNARIGTMVGDHRTSSRGRLLRTWLLESGLDLKNADLAYGKATYWRNSKSSIIDWFVSSGSFINPSMTVRDDLSLDSDHKIIHFTFTLDSPPNTSANSPQRKIWRLSRLKNSNIQEQYAQRFASNIQALRQKLAILLTIEDIQTSQIDDLSDELYEAIYEALDTSVGPKATPPKEAKWFWTPALQAAVKNREFCYRKWRRSVGTGKMIWWIRHQEARAHVRRAIDIRRRQTWRNFCEQLEQGEFTAALAKMKRIRRGRTLQPQYTHELGPQSTAETMATHLENTLAGNLLQPLGEPDTQNTIQSTHTAPSLPTTREKTPDDDPFNDALIAKAICEVPARKAPGIDHLRGEMLHPIVESLTPVLTALFRLCWRCSHTPEAWRIAQIIPIHKKGPTNDPANFRPISLTSIVRKILEHSLKQTLLDGSPMLDIAQGGFRESRSALDQALCLQELCSLHKKKHGKPPVLAFLDIRSAYDTVDRRIIWNALQPYSPPRLIALLKTLFDQVSVEVLLANDTSRRFPAHTGVLQGSVLSPFLYSIYINSLPILLRSVEEHLAPYATADASDSTTQRTNCLLYADDVALIGTQSTMPALLKACEDHSVKLGYRWNPTKCVVLHKEKKRTDRPPPLTLYGQSIPYDEYFTYLGIPFNSTGSIDTIRLIHKNTTGALNSIRTLNTIGVSPSGFDRLLSSRFYRQFIRPKMEYGLAITIFNVAQTKLLDAAQDQCLRLIYGSHRTASTAVMRHLANLPSMAERIMYLQARFLLRAYTLPEDTLLATIRPLLQNSPKSQWSKLEMTKLWNRLPEPKEALGTAGLRVHFRTFRNETLATCRNGNKAILLKACRPKLGIDPLMRVPMTREERSRCTRWRLGWLPGGKPTPCSRCRVGHTSRHHFITCFNTHIRLDVDNSTEDPVSHILNCLPHNPPRQPAQQAYWTRIWPVLHQILIEMDKAFHPESNYTAPPVNPNLPAPQNFLLWITMPR